MIKYNSAYKLPNYALTRDCGSRLGGRREGLIENKTKKACLYDFACDNSDSAYRLL